MNMNEGAQAISVANHYFVLVDGMISGFESYLADDVELKWFGKVIRGKRKVVAFMMADKIESFHTFSNIMPISKISCESKQSNQKIEESMDKRITATNDYLYAPHSSNESKMSTTYNVKDNDQKRIRKCTPFMHKATYDKYEFHFEEYMNSLKSSDCNNADVDKNKLSANAIAAIDDQSYDLNDNDHYNLFEPEITSQPIVGKIQNINRVKLKEEMAPTVRAINRECGQEDGPAEANATKYLEANGEIKLVQINENTDSLFLYHWSKIRRKKCWKRQCTLQIAYSLVRNNNSPKVATEYEYAQTNENFTCDSNPSIKICQDSDKIQKSKLPTLEEAIQASNTIIKNTNYFGGYLQPLNFLEDRANFLKFFKIAVEKKDPNTHFCARYKKNKLILDLPNKKPFNVMYNIHKIIYTNAEKSSLQKLRNKTVAQVRE